MGRDCSSFLLDFFRTFLSNNGFLKFADQETGCCDLPARFPGIPDRVPEGLSTFPACLKSKR